MSDDFYTVSELNNYIKDVVNSGFPQNIWVCGEIQGFNRNRAKSHIFFELVEKNTQSKSIEAKIGLVIFSRNKVHINKLLKSSDNAFELKDDIEVKFSCRVDFYAPHGAMRLIVESIDPTYTLGKLALEKQKLIEKLSKEGVFEKNKQVELATLPLNIGLITSDDSAACNDFLAEFQKSAYPFKVCLRNTLMQGAKTEEDVCKGIDELENLKGIDVIVITRGGGSLADLSFFDSEKIALKIAKSKVPVLTGIGHEINLSITDLTAHTYAKTPTAIAQFIIGCIEHFEKRINEQKESLLMLSRVRVEKEQMRLKSEALRLQEGLNEFLKKHQHHLVEFKQIIQDRPLLHINLLGRSLERLRQLLPKVAGVRIEKENSNLASIKKLIDFAHPVNTMKRGFSITRNAQGNVVRSVKEIVPESALETELVDGIIKSKVELN